MKDLDRIERIISLINKIWYKHPDVRFNQLITYLQRKYDNGKYVKKAFVDEVGWGTVEVSYPDLFNVEDDNFEVFLSDYLNELNG